MALHAHYCFLTVAKRAGIHSETRELHLNLPNAAKFVNEYPRQRGAGGGRAWLKIALAGPPFCGIMGAVTPRLKIWGDRSITKIRMEQDFLLQEHNQIESQKQARQFLNRKETKPVWREYFETAIIAVVAAVLLRIFVVSAYRVNSASMEDALFTGDYIFVNKLAYEYGKTPQIGDVIVFKYPNNPEKDYIKRIVAFPGQTVQVADKIVYVDGRVASLPATAKNTDKKVLAGDLSFRDNFGPYLVPQGQYFVMGDNRDDSQDSRFWGSVPAENIKGKAVFIYWSWDPDPNPPGWSFPYVHHVVQWVGH